MRAVRSPTRPILAPVWVSLLIALATAWGAAAAPADDREPVPAQAEQAEALKRVKEIFAAEYAKGSAADKRALAARLLKESKAAKDELAARYVMLREARQAAVEGGDMDAALLAVAQLAKHYAVEPCAAYVEVMAALGQSPELRGSGKQVGRVCLTLAEVAVARERFDDAGKLCAMAVSAAGKAKQEKLAARAKARGEELKAARAELAKVKPALKKLETDALDPAANLAAGRFVAFVQGDWAAGLPMLAKGSDAAMKDLAERDLAGPSDAADQLALANRYWDLAEKQAALRTRLRERAAYWYAKAQPNLQGLDKLLAEKRGGGGAAAAAADADSHDPVRLGGHTYRYFSAPVGWHLARRLCEQMGGHLVVVDTEAELTFAGKLAGGRDAWLGATDEHKEGDWRWVDGSPVKVRDWWSAEPDNHQGTQHYAFLGENGHWWDSAATDRGGFICEWPG